MATRIIRSQDDLDKLQDDGDEAAPSAPTPDELRQLALLHKNRIGAYAAFFLAWAADEIERLRAELEFIQRGLRQEPVAVELRPDVELEDLKAKIIACKEQGQLIALPRDMEIIEDPASVSDRIAKEIRAAFAACDLLEFISRDLRLGETSADRVAACQRLGQAVLAKMDDRGDVHEALRAALDELKAR